MHGERAWYQENATDGAAESSRASVAAPSAGLLVRNATVERSRVASLSEQTDTEKTILQLLRRLNGT